MVIILLYNEWYPQIGSNGSTYFPDNYGLWLFIVINNYYIIANDFS